MSNCEGYSYIDVFGCLDSDGDGVSDSEDPCPYDPNFSVGLKSEVTCIITSPENELNDQTSSQSEGLLNENALIIIGGIISLMLALIFIAMVAKQAGRRKQVKAMRMEAMVNAELDDETQRRQEWIDYYVAQAYLAKARELGWNEMQANQMQNQPEQNLPNGKFTKCKKSKPNKRPYLICSHSMIYEFIALFLLACSARLSSNDRNPNFSQASSSSTA